MTLLFLINQLEPAQSSAALVTAGKDNELLSPKSKDSKTAFLFMERKGELQCLAK